MGKIAFLGKIWMDFLPIGGPTLKKLPKTAQSTFG
jgi:hypothetical protein